MYIVIEKISEPIVCTDEDGNVLYFETVEAALIESDNCQDGQVVELY
jgi:hypothetical protein